MKRLVPNVQFALLLFLAAFALCLTGCATTDEGDNASERPWNSPKGWENGLPGNMMEGR
jgi:hypothetical protein